MRILEGESAALKAEEKRWEQSSQQTGTMQALRKVNAALKAEIRRLDKRLEGALRYLSNQQLQREGPPSQVPAQPT